MIKKFAKKVVYSFPASVVLMLHRITDNLEEPNSCSLTKDNFEFLLSNFNNWSSLDDIVNKKIKGKITLTFDDGYFDIYERVYPICKEKNIPFTVFVTYGLLDTPGYLTKNQVIELSNDPIVTIGSHNVRHLPLPTLSYEEQEKELLNSKIEIEKLIGKPVNFLAYPYGQNDKRTMKILKKSKAYTHAFIASGLCYNWCFSFNKYRLHRLFVADSAVDTYLTKIKKLTVK